MMDVLYKFMPKIKDIHDRLRKDEKEYSSVSFLIARRVFIIVVSMYFTSLLFTVGGFYTPLVSLEALSMITFHVYSLLVIATMWFGYSFIEYAVYLYAPSKKIITYVL